MLGFISSEHLRYLEEQLTLGVWSWELAGDQLLWSRGLFQILGLSAQNVQPSFDLYRSVVHPDDQLDFSNRRGVATSGTLDYRKFRIIRPTGELRWVESHGRVQFDRNGQPERMIGFARDITDIKCAVDISAAHDSAMQALRELTGAEIWRTSPDGTIIEGANWWQSIADSFLGEDVAGEKGPGRAPSERPFVAASTEPEGLRRGDVRMRQADGSYSRMSTVALPVMSGDGETLGWVGVSRSADLPNSVRYLTADEVPAAQFRAARAYLDLAGQAFAEEVGLSYSTIRRLEGEEPSGAKVGLSTRQHLVDFLARRGVRFIADSSGTPQMWISKAAD